MCGIIGIWHKEATSVSSQLLIKMRDIMQQRGPDDAGVWVDKGIGFGHRRLSIIDLSERGHQPMVDDETGAVITYNGEVYNYQEIRAELEKNNVRFKSKTDTEVILKAYRKWGMNCVNKFNGMFAFAIWDPGKRGIYIARDRMGIKPLYYYNDDKLFMFASRLSPLILHPACSRDIDYEAIGLYLDLGFIPAPWSILKKVKKLNPGHTLWIDEKGLKESCYWNLDSISIDNSLTKVSENELVAKLDYLLQESVRLRMIADVPLGAFLSGGVDSSLIVALMCKYSGKPPETFTVGFKEKCYDESDYARQIARYLGTNHHEEVMTSKDLLTLLSTAVVNYDEPFADYSNLPTMMVSRFAKRHVTVSLSGDGGDELFAGYHCYSVPFYLRYLYNLPYPLRSMMGSLMAKFSTRRYSVVGQSFSQKDLLKSYIFLRSIKGQHKRESLLLQDVLSVEDLFKERSSGFASLDEISKFCRLDLAYYLPDDILQKVDIASMAVSLEARVPILDYRVVEFSQSLPLKYKLRMGSTKWLLKKVLFKYIPKDFFKRPKKGFDIPLDKWFRDELKDMLQDELSVSRIQRLGFLNPDSVQRLIDLHLTNQTDTHHMLGALMSLVKWNESFEKMSRMSV